MLWHILKQSITATILTFPTQFEIQGQWWSNCSTQCLHVGQCFERIGLIIWESKQKIAIISKQSKINILHLKEMCLTNTLHVGQSWDQFPVQTEELFMSRFSKGSCKAAKNTSEKFCTHSYRLNGYDHIAKRIWNRKSRNHKRKEEQAMKGVKNQYSIEYYIGLKVLIWYPSG